MSFSADINKWIDTKAISNENPKKVRDGVALKLLGAFVRDSPVDFGTFRGNWQTNAGSAKRGTLGNRDAASVIGEGVQELKTASMAEDIYISNNLPYASVIEFGDYPGVGPKTTQRLSGIYSTQAPTGVMRKNVVRFDVLIAREAERVNK